MRIDETPARTSIKKASGKRSRVGKSFLTWPDILRAVPRDAARSFVLDLYRFAGFSPDDFAHVRKAREAMADALCRAEDWIESEHPGWRGDGAQIREPRRQLEIELWP